MNRLMTWETWAHGLFGGIIGGIASAVSAWMGMAAAKAGGLDVPALNFKALGVICLTSGITSAAAYLKASPLPEVSKITVTTETTGTTTTVEQSVTKSDKPAELPKP